MRTVMSSALLLLAASAPLAAQQLMWGVSAGAMYGSPDASYQSSVLRQVDGWGLAVSIAPHTPTSALSLRGELSYSYLQNSTGSGNAPEGPLWTHTSHYETAGVAGNVVFNVLGAGHVTSPYLLAGAGLYAVHAASEYNSVIGPYWDNSTSAKLGYDFGFGIRVKSFFVEGRALQLRPIRGWGGDSPMLYSYPISAGFWF